jgi:hypothetical protein
VGAYEREYGKEGEPSNIGKCWWNGKTFGYSDENVGKEREFASSKQNLPWRGLASDPSKGEVTK